MKTMSSEINLFNHEDYGEGYLGMACHVRAMNQLDRIIFEECTVADGAVVAHISMSNHIAPFISGLRSSGRGFPAPWFRRLPW